MNRPLLALPPDSSRQAETSSIYGVDSTRGAIDARKTHVENASREASSRRVWPPKLRIDSPTRGDANADPRSARPEVVLRISVIDGADRLVYVDTRD
ncbi:MAG: hypothetical protein EON54_02490 [Alcaligenaceae bacterium]|nr:MAG: hypothetical protein EON54_02490 [Alcaligenaceae bacterium]